MATDEFRTCCGLLHVKVATWIIGAVHFILVGYIWLMGILYLTGVTDRDHSYDTRTGVPHEFTNFAGYFGKGGELLGVTIWLACIILMLVGLYKNKAWFVLVHLIASALMVIVFVAYIIVAIFNGDKLVNIINPVVVAVAIIALLYIEYRCWEYLKYAPSAPALPR